MAPPRSRKPVLTIPAKPDFSIERALLDGGARFIVGVDEAGRGPLAGPVLASAVVLDPQAIPDGLDDSKKLSERARERIFAAVVSTARVAFASASPAEIDRLNIRAASLLAMRRAVEALHLEEPCAAHCLIDGLDVPIGLPSPATALVQGDARSLSVAAASIVAKVVRDRTMSRLGQSLPGYGFERHMGYGTKVHLEALATHGPCRHHRHSFAPVRHAKAAG